MLDKLMAKHSSIALTKYEIIGSYFVNLIYNELYQKAIDLKNTSASEQSATDIYKSMLTEYCGFSNKPEFFKHALRGIHSYAISVTNLSTMSHAECVAWVTSEVIPEKLYASLRDNQKNQTFHEFISVCVKKFIGTIIAKYLVVIFDRRDQPGNVSLLQAEFLDIICAEKDKTYAKYLTPGDSENVPAHLYRSKLAEFKKLTDELERTKGKFNKLQDIAKKMASDMQTAKGEIKSLTSENKELKDTVGRFREQIDDLKKTIDSLRDTPVQSLEQPTLLENIMEVPTVNVSDEDLMSF